MTTGARHRVASMAAMPDTRPRRRGQAPQPRSGAPQAQGLMAATVVAASSKVPSVARHAHNSIGATTPTDSATTLRIYTSLTECVRKADDNL
jgi:hypothetical protein